MTMQERGPYVTSEAAWDALDTELRTYTPPCDGKALFTADVLSAAEREACAAVCAGCAVADLCDNYATAARVTSGFWAGRHYTPKGIK